MTLDEAYTALSNILEREKHDADCVFRCLVPGCRADHYCPVCAEMLDDDLTPYAAPVARYAPPTKGKEA